jgi:hypothetical protein
VPHLNRGTHFLELRSYGYQCGVARGGVEPRHRERCAAGVARQYFQFARRHRGRNTILVQKSMWCMSTRSRSQLRHKWSISDASARHRPVASPLHAPGPASLARSAPSMAGHSVYRDSCLGKALKSALDEMEMKEVLPSHFTDVAMQAFDAAVLDNLKPEKLIMSTVRPVSLTGEIREGVVESYRFVDNVWTFDLASAKFKGNVFAAKTSVLHVDRIRVIAADVKVVELPSGDAGPSGEGLSSDAHLLAQFDGACCELPLPARAVAARGRGSAIPVPALRVEQRQRPAAELRMVPQADGDVDDDFLEEEEEDDGWEEAPALPVRSRRMRLAVGSTGLVCGGGGVDQRLTSGQN